MNSLQNLLRWTYILDKVNLIILTNIKKKSSRNLKSLIRKSKNLFPNFRTWELEAHSAFLKNLVAQCAVSYQNTAHRYTLAFIIYITWNTIICFILTIFIYYSLWNLSACGKNHASWLYTNYVISVILIYKICKIYSFKKQVK